jgi:hypothetical protein
VNCNQELCIELSSAINFHREIEPAELLQYIYIDTPKCGVTSKRLRTTGLGDVAITFYCCNCSCVSRVAERPSDQGSIPGRGERIFPLASVSRPALGSTQPPVQWVPVSFPRC